MFGERKTVAKRHEEVYHKCKDSFDLACIMCA